MRIRIVGSGVVGLTCAEYLVDRGCEVTISSLSDGPDASCCSWWAGGMLAIGCELETAEPLIGKLGKESIEYWRTATSSYCQQGTLVIAASRDKPLLKDFQRNTTGWSIVDKNLIKTLEPDLSEKYHSGLVFPDEAHIEPRVALQQLTERLRSKNVKFEYGKNISDAELLPDGDTDWIFDCRGLGAKKTVKDLRGVKGEMLHIRTDEITLSRPVRFLHPRIPLYIVPRTDGVFMVGATMIENCDRDKASLRSILELLSSAYAMHSAFGEAEIIEIGVDARPAFPDNLPKIRRNGRCLQVNGMYRHGYLASPALARRAADYIMDGIVDKEVMDEYIC